MSKLITIFGATGNQGGSVIKYILSDPILSKKFKIRGVTRDSSKPAAKTLAEQGVELANADLTNKEQVTAAVKGSDTVFLVTDYWATMDPDIELQQGQNVADAAKQAGVKYIIFSSLLNVTEISGGKLTKVPHFDAKADIEEYIRGTGVPCSFILPGYFMSNMKNLLNKGEHGVYTLAYPVSENAKFPLLDSADTGKWVKVILKNTERYKGKRVYVATDYYTPKQMNADFEEATGSKTRYFQISNEQFKSYLPDFMAEEMLENHLLIESPGYYSGADLKESLDMLEDKPVTWKEFVQNSDIWNN